MYDWYCRFYMATRTSAAHSAFCERAYGKDLCQHGFMDVRQLDRLIDAAELDERSHALDLGCGNGLIAEHISDRTGAHLHGIDYIPEAIQQALTRTEAKRDRLTFAVGDMSDDCLPPSAYDTVIAVDTLYFSDVADTIGRMKRSLKPGGQLIVYYSHSLRWAPGSTADSLGWDRTPLANALSRHGLQFAAWDVTAEDRRNALVRQEVLADLEPQFRAEGNLFIFENRMADSRDVVKAIDDGVHCRYLYRARL